MPVESQGNTWKGWYYFVDPVTLVPQEYSLSQKVGIDPVLGYIHHNSQTGWYYDPGTGAEKTTLPFTQPG